MKSALACVFLALAALPAAATDMSAQLTAMIDKDLRPIAADPALVAAVLAANAAHAPLSAAQIDSLDKAWRAEIDSANRPTIDPILADPVSQALHGRVSESLGRISEIFVMDNRGLNVAQSGVTSDYWQGDEDKFAQTYPLGAAAVHLSAVEFDDSTQTYQIQASFTVIDPASGAAIGAMTVGLNAEMIQ